nr:MAG: hypothetical protein 1 [Leviviridae sp.]
MLQSVSLVGGVGWLRVEEDLYPPLLFHLCCLTSPIIQKELLLENLERRRSRKLDPIERVAYSTTYAQPGVVNETISSFSGGQVTIDRKNNWHNMRRLQAYNPMLRKYDFGADFTTTKYTYSDDVRRYNLLGGSTRFPTSFEGPLYAQVLNATHDGDSTTTPSWWQPIEYSSENDLIRDGSYAIATCKPASSHASVANSLGELYRDGLPALPMLIKRKTGFKESLMPSQLGAELLNVQFAISPLISDFQKIIEAKQKAKKIISQYYRDSGKIVRRKFQFPEEITTTVSRTDANRYPTGGPSSQYYMGGASIVTTIKTTKKKWFSGAFTYHAPPEGGLGLMRAIEEGDQLYGVAPDLEDLYNLTPWSWAVDWFVNLGDAVSNFNSFVTDGLVMHWGYLMEHTIQEVTYHLEGCRTSSALRSGGGQTVLGTQTFSSERKVRRRATPFGFGIKEEAFTPRQWSIIAALGLTSGGRYVAW